MPNDNPYSNMKTAFEKIFREHLWAGGDETRSGSGSTLVSTKQTRANLQSFFKEYNIQTVADAGCGDSKFMIEVTKELKGYFGYDIVTDLIEFNRHRAESEGYHKHFYAVADTSKTIPVKADLILSRDVFIHIKNIDIMKTINNFKDSGSTYMLVSSFFNQNADSPFFERLNGDVRYGGYRRIDLTLEPFSLPEPLEIIEDPVCDVKGNFSEKHKGRSLALWKLDDIKHFKINE